MPYQTSPRVPVSLIVLLVSTFLLVYGVARYRQESQKPELFAFVGFMSAISLTQVGVIMGDAVIQLERQLFWVNFVNGIALLLVIYTLLWFALAYADHSQLINRWTVGVAVCHVVASGIAVAVAPELMYDVTGQSTNGPVTFVGITFEEWVFLDREPKLPFTLIQLYSYVIVLVSGLILARYIVRNHVQLYTGQVATLTVGLGTPLLLNSLVLSGAVSLTVNYTTMSMGVTSIAFAIAIFQYRLFRLPPVGRQQLIDAMDDPVIMVDTENRVVDCNRTARNLSTLSTGWRRVSMAEFFDSCPVELTKPEDFANTEISCTQRGERRNFDPLVTPIYAEKTRLVGYGIVLREVTELYQQNQQIKEQNQKLEQFAGVISHDLRNPLNVAQLRNDLVIQESDIEHAEDVKQALNRMETMVDDLLVMAQAGEAIEETHPVPLTDVATDAWDHVETSGGDLEVQIPAGVTVESDRERLLQIFENLFRNTFDHNSSPVQIHVGTLDTSAESAESVAGFYIEDDGSGIPPEKRSEVMNHGYTTSEDGLGFGLAIVHDAVTAHGWTITVTEADCGGARFEIRDVTISTGG